MLSGMISLRRALPNAAIAITLWCVFTFRTIWGVSIWFKACFWLAVMGLLIASFEGVEVWLHAPADARVSLVAFVMFAVGLFGLKHIRSRERHGN
jgi:hypothetical protein